MVKIEAHVAPVMRASLPLRGIGAYVPAKESDIGGNVCYPLRSEGDDLRLVMAIRWISKEEEARGSDGKKYITDDSVGQPRP